MHIFVDPETPLKCSVWPQFRYYLSIAGAIILENLVIARYKTLRRRRRVRRVSTKESISVGKSTSIADVVSVDRRIRSNYSNKHEQQKGPEIQSNKVKESLKDESVEDPFMKIVPWLGYLWVFFFEAWPAPNCCIFRNSVRYLHRLVGNDWLRRSIMVT